MTANASGNSFFIFGNKDKLWIVGNVFGSQCIQEFKNYSLYSTAISIQNSFDTGQFAPVELELKLACHPTDFSSIYASSLDPEDFYSMPEITKLSKIITRKLSKMKKK